jgi:hypothetical protein
MKKKVIIAVVIIFIGALCFGISRIVQNPEQYQKKEENVSVVLDCSKFSRISTNELESELGEPKTTEDWNNQASKGAFQMQIFTYEFEGFYGEFILYEDTVVKLRLFSDSQWKVEGSNSDNIFAMFGIVPGENAKKTVDTGITYKFSPVSDRVAEVEFYNYDKKEKTFDAVYVTYNLNFFD